MYHLLPLTQYLIRIWIVTLKSNLRIATRASSTRWVSSESYANPLLGTVAWPSRGTGKQAVVMLLHMRHYFLRSKSAMSSQTLCNRPKRTLSGDPLSVTTMLGRCSVYIRITAWDDHTCPNDSQRLTLAYSDLTRFPHGLRCMRVPRLKWLTFGRDSVASPAIFGTSLTAEHAASPVSPSSNATSQRSSM